MASLGETYERRAGEASRRRVYLGTGLFATGALLVVAGIVAGASGLLISNGFSVYESREIAGILAGLGIPAVFVGIFSVLPANRFQRAAAAFGAGLAVLGVMVFRYAYPYRWYAAEGVPSTLVLALTIVYFAGVITTFWCLFTAVATFKTRNDPGGTVTLTVTEDGETRTVEVPRGSLDDARAALGGGASMGGVGIFGGVDDPGNEHPATASSVSDGGTAAQDLSSPLDDANSRQTAGGSGSAQDEYCGSCRHFDYVQGDGMQPYCDLYEEQMDDMAACEWWESNQDA